MAIPRFEVLSGAINGVNLVFTTSAAYTPGSVAVFLNGQLLKAHAGDPWAETDPANGVVTVAGDCVPRDGDHIAAFYLDTLDDFVGSEVSEMTGTVTAVVTASGQLGDAETPVGSLLDVQQVCGILADEALTGSVVSTEVVSGKIEVC